MVGRVIRTGRHFTDLSTNSGPFPVLSGLARAFRVSCHAAVLNLRGSRRSVARFRKTVHLATLTRSRGKLLRWRVSRYSQGLSPSPKRTPLDGRVANPLPRSMQPHLTENPTRSARQCESLTNRSRSSCRGWRASYLLAGAAVLSPALSHRLYTLACRSDHHAGAMIAPQLGGGFFQIHDTAVVATAAREPCVLAIDAQFVSTVDQVANCAGAHQNEIGTSCRESQRMAFFGHEQSCIQPDCRRIVRGPSPDNSG